MSDFITPSLDPIVARLAAETTCFRDVAVGFDLDAGLDQVRAGPAALVLPAGASYGPNMLDGQALRQERTHFFSVMIVLTGTGPTGEKASAQFEQTKNATLGAIAGWRHPEGNGTKCEPVVERLVAFDAKTHRAVYEIRFKHRHHTEQL